MAADEWKVTGESDASSGWKPIGESDASSEWKPVGEATEVDPPEAHTTAGGVAASLTRGIAPVAAGAGIGLAAGGPPGALAGAGAVAITDATLGAYNTLARQFGWPQAASPKAATDYLLDKIGINRPSTAFERGAETTAEGVAGAVSGAGGAKLVAQTATNPFVKGTAETLATGPTRQAISGATGGAAAQTAHELGAGPLGTAFAGMAGSAVPGAHPMNLTRTNASENARRAINAGFRLPPAYAAEGREARLDLSNIFGAEGGRVKNRQLAAVRNQPVVNDYVKIDLGVPRTRSTILSPKTLQEVRDRELKVYDEVKNAVPEVDLGRDPAFKATIENIGNPHAETERLFPSTKRSPEVEQLLAEATHNARGKTEAVMNYISDLRFKANKNFDKDQDAAAHRLGLAQREVAFALEDAMERSIQNAPAYFQSKLGEANQALAQAQADLAHVTGVGSNSAYLAPAAQKRVMDATNEVKRLQQGLQDAQASNSRNQDLVERFRKARTTIAKTFDVEAVTNPATGDVSAMGLASLQRHGKPLTGGLHTVADAANSFPPAFQNPAAFGGTEPMSVLDVAAATASLATGHVAPAVTVLLRNPLRSYALSPGYQARMVSPMLPYSPLPAFLSPGPAATAETLGAGP